MAVVATTNEHKAGLRLLGLLPPHQGHVVTSDAIFTHRDYAQKVLDSGRNYVLYAKGNQPEARNEIAYNFQAAQHGYFSPSVMKQFLAESQSAESRLPKSHGRREERWPGVGQVFELVRIR